MLPSSKDLIYFLEVVKTLNVTRASERLGITQPTLTQSIQRLESDIGVPLLFRSKTGVALTPAGKKVFVQADRLLAQWDKVRGDALASMDEVRGQYKLGCHTSVGIYSLPLVLPSLMAQNPHLELQIFHHLSRKVFEGVVSMELDFGLVINPSEHPDIVIVKLGRDEIGLWVAAQPAESQDPKKGSPVFICDPDLLQTQVLLSKVSRLGIQPSRIVTSSSLEVVAHLTAAGVGIGFLPARVARVLGPSKLKLLSESAPRYADQIAFIYRTENRKIKTFRVLSEAFGRAFSPTL